MAIQNFDKKLVLVTGAGSGIGRETAIAFAKQGAILVLVDLNASGLIESKQKVEELGAQCVNHQVDISCEAAMSELAFKVHHQLGALDVLVNNAGVAYLGSFLTTPFSKWQEILNVNLLGAVLGCQHFLPHMLKAGGARHIVNVASAAGIAPTVNMSAYATSKHAVMGFSDSLALELSNTSVSVSVICPGIINTSIANPSPSNVGANITTAQIKRLGEFYRIKGIHPRVVGDSIVHAVRHGKGLVLVGPYAGLLYQLRRISRGLQQRVMLADAKKLGYL